MKIKNLRKFNNRLFIVGLTLIALIFNAILFGLASRSSFNIINAIAFNASYIIIIICLLYNFPKPPTLDNDYMIYNKLYIGSRLGIPREYIYYKHGNINNIDIMMKEINGGYMGGCYIIKHGNNEIYWINNDIFDIILTYELPPVIFNMLLESHTNNAKYKLALNLVCLNINNLKENQYEIVKRY